MYTKDTCGVFVKDEVFPRRRESFLVCRIAVFFSLDVEMLQGGGEWGFFFFCFSCLNHTGGSNAPSLPSAQAAFRLAAITWYQVRNGQQ